jgi:hypothetical protein
MTEREVFYEFEEVGAIFLDIRLFGSYVRTVAFASNDHRSNDVTDQS